MGRLEVAQLLIGAKADVNAQNVSRMWSALFISEFRNRQYALNSPPYFISEFMCMFGDNALVLNVVVRLAVWFARCLRLQKVSDQEQ